MRKLVALLHLQHLLYLRWFVYQFNVSIRPGTTHLLSLFIGAPFVVSFLAYYLFRAIFLLARAGGFLPEWEHVSIAFSLIYLFLGLGFAGGSYRETYIRAFHSKDWEFIRVHHSS